jgi:hypothetical protein
LVRLACFPSTASKVYINTIPCKLKKVEALTRYFN